MTQRKEGIIRQISTLKVPMIRPGDDLIGIVLTAIAKNIGFENVRTGDIIAITEAVLAISQDNFVTKTHIHECISAMFGKEVILVDPIQSRNRFLEILKAIASTPTLEKVYIYMTYPRDEVGNPLVSDSKFYQKGNNFNAIMSVREFCEIYGEPKHPFTGVNYFELYQQACEGKAEIILGNDFTKVLDYCKDVLVCSIHRRDVIKSILKENGAEKVFDLSDIMKEPNYGSGYNSEYGLYGSNKMGDKLKLMPRDSQFIVEFLQSVILRKTGKKVEVMIFGDGAFKDPKGGIWELADPTTTLGATSGLMGRPQEVKLKNLVGQYPDKSQEELQQILDKARVERKQQGIDSDNSLGTTPRQITDLVASLCDLSVGSGDAQTPIVYITGYFQ